LAGAGLDAGFAAGAAIAGFADAGLAAAAAFAAGFEAVVLAAGFVLAFAGVVAAFALGAATVLADGAFGLSGPAAGFEAVFAFAGAVVFAAFATNSSLAFFRAASLLNDRNVLRCSDGTDLREEIRRAIYVLRLSAAVQVLPLRQDEERFAAENLRLPTARSACSPGWIARRRAMPLPFRKSANQ